MPMLVGAIQTGGRSSRMGEDKAWLTIDDKSMIEWVLEAASPLVDGLCLCVGDRDRVDDRYARLSEKWNAALLIDVEPDFGPLSGILAALRQFHRAEDGRILVLACDLPFIRTSFLDLIRQIHETEGSVITVPLDPSDRPQPLASIYDVSCLNVAEEHFAMRRLRVDLLFDRVPTRRIGYHEYSHLSGAEWFLSNINSPEDVESSRGRIRSRDPGNTVDDGPRSER